MPAQHRRFVVASRTDLFFGHRPAKRSSCRLAWQRRDTRHTSLPSPNTPTYRVGLFAWPDEHSASLETIPGCSTAHDEAHSSKKAGNVRTGPDPAWTRHGGNLHARNHLLRINSPKSNPVARTDLTVGAEDWPAPVEAVEHGQYRCSVAVHRQRLRSSPAPSSPQSFDAPAG